MISHYYLQRTELRDERHRATGAEDAMSKGVAVAEDLAGLSAGGRRVGPLVEPLDGERGRPPQAPREGKATK